MKENSIEEDIKIINNFITYFNKNIQDGNKADLIVLGEEINAIEHILSDYKRVLKENEYMHNELDKQQTTINKYTKENEYYKECLEVVSKHLNNIDYDQILFAIYEYYISRQKVKDKIKEIDEKIKYEENEKVVIYLHKQKNILQELIDALQQ